VPRHAPSLNERVDVKGEPVAQVAADWLKEEGFIA
jgi:osmoprotectant transport system substrate-binding protein